MKRKKNVIATVSKAAAAFSLLMGMILSAGISSKAAAINVDSNNNDIFTAANIDLNTTYVSNISDRYDEDWYHFVIPSTAKESYFNIILGPENANSQTINEGWKFYIYRKNEANPFYESDQYQDKRTSSNFPYGPGEYYLKIVTIRDILLGNYAKENYNFQVKFTNNANWETEDNDTLQTANIIRVNETYHGNMLDTEESRKWVYDKDEDNYKFTISKPGEVSITMGPDPLVDITKLNGGWELKLYREGETSPLIELNEIEVTTSSNKLILNAGTYIIRISEGSSLAYINGKTYDFKVTYKETQTSTTKPGTTTTKPNTTATDNKNTVTSLKKSDVIVSSVKSKPKKKVYLKWKKNKYADGYKVYRSTRKKKGYKCIATIKKKSTVSYTDKKVKSNKVYYYKVRAYRKNGKKTAYSGYSPVKKVKVK